MDYHILREFADSWAALAMLLMFLGAVFWAFRPGSRSTHADTANIPFRHEDKPADPDAGDSLRPDDGATR
ncbi:CcoQ/FixQ family Cbb3-type cytochrome c oxidase assembly chaperone [Rhodobacter sp. TJ_12]|uniref:cbb3-type cytochrome c oxidase subunit 3 n=1 Tax=Rhodobacter sp. TJ_12 TaxID=2029399 RepID=UPI001CBB2513|nr:cbb3-type cytochrome c oxidase subunit 3 [Rhodobacter sp. TJ_12]MBZ4021428.1 CcoQ/FixQ family Cbb3-type cytochrome c oxidase assembly chaperone [Rhodobacter sp. TJ_12]